MFNPALKIGLITTAVGVTGTTLYLTSKSTNKEETSLTEKKSIGEFLKEDGLQLLTDKDDTEWPKKWKAFVEAQKETEPTGEWAIEGWKDKKGQLENTPQEFKQICKANGGQKVENRSGDLYKKVSSYCTKALAKGHA